MIARKPILEKLIAQKEKAVRYALISPALALRKISFDRRKTPKTVSVPMRMDASLSESTLGPMSLMKKAWMFMNKPSRPLLSG